MYTHTSPRSRSHRSAADIPYTAPVYSSHRVYSMSTPICK